MGRRVWARGWGLWAGGQGRAASGTSRARAWCCAQQSQPGLDTAGRRAGPGASAPSRSPRSVLVGQPWGPCPPAEGRAGSPMRAAPLSSGPSWTERARSGRFLGAHTLTVNARCSKGSDAASSGGLEVSPSPDASWALPPPPACSSLRAREGLLPHRLIHPRAAPSRPGGRLHGRGAWRGVRAEQPGRSARPQASCCPWAAAARLPRPWTPCPLQESAMAPEWGSTSQARTASKKDLCRCCPPSKGPGGVSEGSPSSVTGVLREEGDAERSLEGAGARLPCPESHPGPIIHHPSVHPLIACGP